MLFRTFSSQRLRFKQGESGLVQRGYRVLTISVWIMAMQGLLMEHSLKLIRVPNIVESLLRA